MGDERVWSNKSIFQEEKDYTEQANAAIADAEQFVQHGKVQEALDRLLQLEKMCRQGNDVKSGIKIAHKIVAVIVAEKDWKLLMETLETLSKKRAQMKQVVTAIVHDSMKVMETLADLETKIQLVKCLRGITDGKIHVELEYARLSVMLAQMWDADGKLDEACELMQGLQVETIGNMERKEKVEIILSQVEMSLRKNDYTIAFVITKKIPHRSVDKHDTKEHKIRFYTLLGKYYEYVSNYLMLAYCYQKIYNIVYDTSFSPEEVKGQFSTPEEKMDVARKCVFYSLLSSSSAKPETDEEEAKKEQLDVVDDGKSERTRLLERFNKEKSILEEPHLKYLLKAFTEYELIDWEELNQFVSSQKSKSPIDGKEERWDLLQRRVHEHNILVVNKYFCSATLEGISPLVGLGPQKLETLLCEMVVEKQINMKINRVSGKITFAQHTTRCDDLNEWSDGVASVLEVLSSVSHLVFKEKMIAEAMKK